MRNLLAILLMFVSLVSIGQTDLNNRIPLRMIYPIDTLDANINKPQWKAYIESLLIAQTYPGAGIALSTGTAWGTSITNNSGNWDTAYGWGDHAIAGYGTMSYWNFYANGSLLSSVVNGDPVDFVAGTGISLSYTAPALTITSTGGDVYLASDNAFTGYNTIVKSRAGSALNILNQNASGLGLLSTGTFMGIDARGSTYDIQMGTSGKIKIATFAAAPASATATGSKGTVIITGTYIYVCSATDTWVRTSLATW